MDHHVGKAPQHTCTHTGALVMATRQQRRYARSISLARKRLAGEGAHALLGILQRTAKQPRRGCALDAPQSHHGALAHAHVVVGQHRLKRTRPLVGRAVVVWALRRFLSLDHEAPFSLILPATIQRRIPACVPLPSRA